MDLDNNKFIFLKMELGKILATQHLVLLEQVEFLYLHHLTIWSIIFLVQIRNSAGHIYQQTSVMATSELQQ
jgi:hypothetical protein